MNPDYYDIATGVFTNRNIHRHYRLEIPWSKSSALADVFAFEGERVMGMPSKFTISFTHPERDLPRSDYLNKPAIFVIQPPYNPNTMPLPEPRRTMYGMLTSFAQLGSSRDETTYEVVLESRLALLRNAPKCRFFLNQSFPEIIEMVLRDHKFDMISARFKFDLHYKYEKRAFVMQWEEDDLSFITRLCRRSGIWFVCEEGEYCEIVRFGDYFTRYRHNPRLTVPYRTYSGLESSGSESVDSLHMRSKTVPTRFTLRSYNHERAPQPIDATTEIRNDRTTYGETYTWGTPYLTEEEGKREAVLRSEAALSVQIEYHGTCDMLDLVAGSVVHFSNRELPDAPSGLLAVSVRYSASRSKPYRVSFTAIPCGRLYRLPLLEHTWPRINGTITGTIASPDDPIHGPYLDDAGRYIVNLHLDRDDRLQGENSCPMRFAKAFAGGNRSGLHFGLVAGTEVTVAFHHGNPDLPYISQALHNEDQPDPIIGQRHWYRRSTIRTRSNNTIEFEDSEHREHIKVATEQGKSQLNLGHTVDVARMERGNGFEVRSDLTGCVRAGGGILLSADMQAGAIGKQTDMTAAIEQISSTLAAADDLAAVARISAAGVSDIKAENKWLREELMDLKKAVIALSAPHGIGISTPDRVLVSAGKDVSVVTTSSFNVSAIKNIVVAASDALSIFAYKMGITLIAARGNVSIQAQTDAIDIASDKDTTITSSNGRVIIEAKNELILKCGGSYISLTTKGIEDGTQGVRAWKAGGFSRQAPASINVDLPVLPKPADHACALQASKSNLPFKRF